MSHLREVLDNSPRRSTPSEATGAGPTTPIEVNPSAPAPTSKGKKYLLFEKGVRDHFGISSAELNAQNKGWMLKNGYYAPKVKSTNTFTIFVPSRYKRHPDLDGYEPPAWLKQWQAKKNG